MKILVDMNLTPLWCPVLSAAGFEATHWSAIGSATASDEEIMSHAQAHGFVVFTEDLDFGILLARNRLRGPSVVQLRTGMNLPRQIGHRVLDALGQAHSLLEDGALLSIGSSHNRITRLPLR